MLPCPTARLSGDGTETAVACWGGYVSGKDSHRHHTRGRTGRGLTIPLHAF